MWKIAIIGTIVRDTIFPFKGQRVEGWGGIFYSISYLSEILRQQAVLFPICDVGKDHYEELLTLLQSKFKNVRTEGIRQIEAPTNRVTLRYTSRDQRIEKSQHIPQPIEFQRIVPFLDSNVLYVNFISGFDLSLSTMQCIQQQKEDLLFMDFHSLALGRRQGGVRFFRRPANWKQWVCLPDILQMNEKEAEILSGNPLRKISDYQTFALQLSRIGTKSGCITLGQRGCLIFKNANGKTEIHHLPPLKVSPFVDATGCGDAFAAGMIAKYLETRDLVTAARYGNLAGGLNCTFPSTSQVEQIHLLWEKAERCYQKGLIFKHQELTNNG